MKISKLCLCDWNPPVTYGFLSSRANNTENVAPWHKQYLTGKLWGSMIKKYLRHWNMYVAFANIAVATVIYTHSFIFLLI